VHFAVDAYTSCFLCVFLGSVAANVFEGGLGSPLEQSRERSGFEEADRKGTGRGAAWGRGEGSAGGRDAILATSCGVRASDTALNPSHLAARDTLTPMSTFSWAMTTVSRNWARG
jgi:hypothetical protein